MMFKSRLQTVMIIIGIVLCFLFIINMSIRFTSPHIDNYIKMAIYPSSGGPSHTYYFVLDADTGKMFVTEGTRSREVIDLRNRHFMMGGRRFETEKETVYLSLNESDEIVSLLDLILSDETCGNSAEITDTWGIAIYYNNRTVQNSSYQDSEKLKELVRLLSIKTSIEMKFQGFA